MPVSGDKEVAAMLRKIARIPNATQGKRARGVALQPIITEAKANLFAQKSVITGALYRALGIGEKDKNTTAAGPLKGKKHANVAHLVEFGTRPHFQPRRFGGIYHPGARPKPFMRPAFEHNKVRVQEILAQEIAKLLGGVLK